MARELFHHGELLEWLASDNELASVFGQIPRLIVRQLLALDSADVVVIGFSTLKQIKEIFRPAVDSPKLTARQMLALRLGVESFSSMLNRRRCLC